ncbi:hypothetical protein K435DRAFT_878655 [Dendrothele bispora CBS 962.96]|uniref:Spherulation-specific family 4 n=1 Tax=Dendrothele bispora (strain CBS 962.96) TaxID=1314807 RepID=A0A4S8KMK8_DENBC|nr:hypothetical protein K435DRAFT_878655 [Dendrothele bispora CBS 962.96]
MLFNWAFLGTALLVLKFYTGGVFAQLNTGAIFPLYIYPESCDSWGVVADSISANPTLPFYIVINPSSGPGDGPVPDPGYQECIPDLVSRSDNVRTVGYVRTNYGNQDPSDVLGEIETYSNWGASYRPNGIFFDEVNATTDHVQLYSSYAERVRQDFGSDSVVVLNPGIPVTVDDYFEIADLIITAENFYDEFDVSSLQISETKPASEQAVLLHTAPQTLPTSLIDELTGLGIGALFITNKVQAEAYNTTPTYWGEFCEELVDSQT